MKINQPYYLIIDLEATCCDQGSIPRSEMEMIEIGAVLLNSQSLEVEDEFGTFIRPVRHPVLTPFCTRLTSIRQQDVAEAPAFPEALKKLHAWIRGNAGFVFCSWGAYDRGQFQRDCAWHQVPYPFPAGHLNLKQAFLDALGLKKRLGMDQALKHLGMELQGIHHRGIDDARNMARIVQTVLRNGGALTVSGAVGPGRW